MSKQEWKIGDCLELLPTIEDKSIDMILTDLPYGKTQNDWDTIIDLNSLWSQYTRIIKDNGAVVLFGQNPFSSMLIMSNIKMYKYDWAWNKSIVTGHLNAKKRPMSCIENIHIFYKKQPCYNPIMWKSAPMNSVYRGNVSQSDNYGRYLPIKTPKDELNRTIRYPKNLINISSLPNNAGERNGHPTQKPVALFEYLIKTYTNEGDVVHDSCLGSGTTLEACLRTNRNCVGFEISDEWIPHYKKRLISSNSKLTDNWSK